jgi:hypothetical protein
MCPAIGGHRPGNRSRPALWRRFSYLRVHGTFLSRAPVRHGNSYSSLPVKRCATLASRRVAENAPHHPRPIVANRAQSPKIQVNRAKSSFSNSWKFAQFASKFLLLRISAFGFRI